MQGRGLHVRVRQCGFGGQLLAQAGKCEVMKRPSRVPS